MSHPVIEKRNEEIKKEFKKFYKKYLDGEMYVEEILAKLSKKYHLTSESIEKIVYPK